MYKVQRSDVVSMGRTARSMAVTAKLPYAVVPVTDHLVIITGDALALDQAGVLVSMGVCATTSDEEIERKVDAFLVECETCTPVSMSQVIAAIIGIPLITA